MLLVRQFIWALMPALVLGAIGPRQFSIKQAA
jgi:hypothetical protein